MASHETVELPKVTNRGLKNRRNMAIATSILGVVGIAACFGSNSGNGGQVDASPSHTTPGITTPGESKSPVTSPSPSVSPEPSSTSTKPGQPLALSLCNSQFGTQEGQLPSGTPTLPATVLRPSIFVVSPDRSGRQAFTVRAADSQGAWNSVAESPSVGIVGIATADTVFDTTGGQAVWGKTCEPTPAAGIDEVDSRANDLCKRKDLGITKVVVYQIGSDGKPKGKTTRPC